MATGKPRRKLKLMPARLKALRLHGRYLGYMRQQAAGEGGGAGPPCEEGGQSSDCEGTQAGHLAPSHG